VSIAAQNAKPSGLDETMKRVGSAEARSVAAIRSLRYSDAKAELPTIRTGIMESSSFFKARNADNGVKFANAVIEKLEALGTALDAAEHAAEDSIGELAALDAAMKRVGA